MGNVHLGQYRLHIFLKEEQPRLFEEHCKIKYQVFINEQGWQSLAYLADQKIVLEDAFDAQGIFVLVENSEGKFIGTVRGHCTSILENLPHGKLFKHHQKTLPGTSSDWVFATINSLAILPEFRGRRLSGASSIAGTSLSEAILIVLLEKLRSLGGRLVFVAVLPDSSAKLCAHLGFRVIDPPYRYDKSDVSAINMGLVNHENQGLYRSFLPDYLPAALPELNGQDRLAINYFSSAESTLANTESVRRLFEIRQRSLSKPSHTLKKIKSTLHCLAEPPSPNFSRV